VIAGNDLRRKMKIDGVRLMRVELGQGEVGAGPAETGEAFYELGLMYAAGRAVPVDRVTAHKWFNVAVAQGYRAAAPMRAEMSQEMSQEEIAAAQREARLFLTRH
jgi:TPR repeat protein